MKLQASQKLPFINLHTSKVESFSPLEPLNPFLSIASLASSDFFFNKEIQKQIDNGGKSNYCYACKKEVANKNQH